ncbi:MAG: rod shape-determining protein MreD [Gammaproteobacteria bacterium]|nr:rod shape-determining protein MreD [Gammaproteobacteria bacterium]MCH9744421.1 rod shape-determining protein MreD [Gammaproteobacteria bacterium]
MREHLWLIFTVICALLLTILPLPAWIVWARPQWTFLVVLFWCVSSPNQSRIAMAWFVGFVMDLLTGTVLGQHAFIYSVIGYLGLKFSRRLRQFPLLQQSLLVFLVSIVNLVSQYIMMTLYGVRPISWMYWLPCITNAIVWPWMCILLQEFVEKLDLFA